MIRREGHDPVHYTISRRGRKQPPGAALGALGALGLPASGSGLGLAPANITVAGWGGVEVEVRTLCRLLQI